MKQVVPELRVIHFLYLPSVKPGLGLVIPMLNDCRHQAAEVSKDQLQRTPGVRLPETEVRMCVHSGVG